VIVLVHGLGLSHRYYTRLQPLLPAAHAVDLHGGTLEALSDSLARQAPSRALLVANSLGAQVAVELAASGTIDVRGLVLTGPTCDLTAPSVGRQLLRLLRDSYREPPTLVPVALADYVRRGPRQILAEARGMMRHPMADTLARVQAPVIVLRGSRDPICSQAWAEELVRRAPDGRLRVVPGAAHAVDWSHPRVVVDAVEELEQQLGEE
jgi:pimeloyl-ACP methyl ester carboxylesterase